MTWEVRQTRRFARAYKKLHDRQAADVDAAVATVADDPERGEKKGDLAELWVYRFHSHGQLLLLGYPREAAGRYRSKRSGSGWKPPPAI